MVHLALHVVLELEHLLDAEVAHVVRRYALTGEIDAERGAEMVDVFDEVDTQQVNYKISFSELDAWLKAP